MISHISPAGAARRMTTMEEILPGLLMKFELENPAGSHKWRSAQLIIDRAVERGDIVPGQTTVLEKTGGNFGFGLALACRKYSIPVEVVVGLTFSAKKRQLLENFGAKSVALDKLEAGMKQPEVIDWLLDHQRSLGRSYYFTDQHHNPDGVEAHEVGTGGEIISQLQRFAGLERVTFVGCAGTGAHMTGVCRALQSAGLLAEAVLVEPEGCDSRESVFVPHTLEGISVGIAPPLLDWDLVGRHRTVSHEDMLTVQDQVIAEYGYLIGNTSAACLKVSFDLIREISDKAAHKVLTIAYDHALWYI